MGWGGWDIGIDHTRCGTPGVMGKKQESPLFRPKGPPDGSFCQFSNCNHGASWDLSFFSFFFFVFFFFFFFFLFFFFKCEGWFLNFCSSLTEEPDYKPGCGWLLSLGLQVPPPITSNSESSKSRGKAESGSGWAGLWPKKPGRWYASTICLGCSWRALLFPPGYLHPVRASLARRHCWHLLLPFS